MEKISGFLGGDGGVALDQRGEHAAQRLDAERQRGHVEQEHVLDFALEHAALDGGADGDDFVRVHALVRGLSDELVGGLHHFGHAGHAADEHQFVNLRRRSMPASFRQSFTGPMVRSNRSSHSCSILARVSFILMCFGPLASAVMNGRLIS